MGFEHKKIILGVFGKNWRFFDKNWQLFLTKVRDFFGKNGKFLVKFGNFLKKKIKFYSKNSHIFKNLPISIKNIRSLRSSVRLSNTRLTFGTMLPIHTWVYPIPWLKHGDIWSQAQKTLLCIPSPV